jgi:hypothetical protein
MIRAAAPSAFIQYERFMPPQMVSPGPKANPKGA